MDRPPLIRPFLQAHEDDAPVVCPSCGGDHDEESPPGYYHDGFDDGYAAGLAAAERAPRGRRFRLDELAAMAFALVAVIYIAGHVLATQLCQ